MQELNDSTVDGGLSPVFGSKHPLKWFGLSLSPYRDDYKDDLAALCAPHFARDGGLERLEPIVRKYAAGVFAITRLAPGRRFAIVGFTAFLPLSEYGVRLIEFGVFDGADLQPEALAPDFRRAAAIYWWATVAEGGAIRSLPLIELALSQPPFAGKDIFATAGTPRGLNAMLRLGFAPLRSGEAPRVGVVVARRLAARASGERSYAH